MIHICYLPAGRSVSWKTVTEVLKMLPEAAGKIENFRPLPEPIRLQDLENSARSQAKKKISKMY